MIRFRDVSFTYDGADRPTLDHVDLVVGGGRAVRGGRADRVGQDDPAACRQRTGSPLHRRPPLGGGAGRRTVDPGVPPP